MMLLHLHYFQSQRSAVELNVDMMKYVWLDVDLRRYHLPCVYVSNEYTMTDK